MHNTWLESVFVLSQDVAQTFLHLCAYVNVSRPRAVWCCARDALVTTTTHLVECQVQHKLMRCGPCYNICNMFE